MMQRLHCVHAHGCFATLPQLKASSLCVAHVHVKHMAAALKQGEESVPPEDCRTVAQHKVQQVQHKWAGQCGGLEPL